MDRHIGNGGDVEPKCKVSSKMLSRIVLFSISVVALEFGAVLFL